MPPVILGGGISGLSTAYYLSKSVFGLKLYESTNRVGGWINSFKTKKGGLFELGPRTLKHDGILSENTLKLCDDVGLTSKIVPVKVSNLLVKNKFIYFEKQLVSLPSGFSSLFRIKPPFVRPLLYALWNDLKAQKREINDESVYDFIKRRFGEDYAEMLCSALVCGIFAGDAKEISVRAIMKDSFEDEQKYGGVIRGIMKGASKRRKMVSGMRKETMDWIAWSFQDGLETLPIHLKEYLEKQRIEICLEKKCSKIAFKNGKAILTIDDEEEVTDHLYCALPSRELARILEVKHSFLKEELSSIPFVTVGVVNLEYEGDLIKNKGFGFLVPPNQNLPILGTSYDSCIFPKEGKTILTVMMGGRWFQKYFGTNPDESSLLQTAEEHIRSILNINSTPVESKVTVLRNCIPQYLVGHYAKVEKIREYIEGNELPLTLIGNSFDGVGVNDAILSARNNVEKSSPMIKAKKLMMERRKRAVG